MEYIGIYPIPNKFIFTYTYDFMSILIILFMLFIAWNSFMVYYASYQLGPNGTNKWDTLQGICYN